MIQGPTPSTQAVQTFFHHPSLESYIYNLENPLDTIKSSSPVHKQAIGYRHFL
jgi:hypothetical protein